MGKRKPAMTSSGSIRMHGEETESWDELKEYAEVEGDAKIAAMVDIVERYDNDVIEFNPK